MKKKTKTKTPSCLLSKHQQKHKCFQLTIIWENSCDKLQVYCFLICYYKREERSVCDESSSEW